MPFKTSNYHGTTVSYTPDTRFLVQIGKGKGSYKTVRHLVGDLQWAILTYNSYNIEGGFKKRIIMATFDSTTVNKSVIARSVSK